MSGSVTVAAVCVIGTVEPSSSSSLDGDPGWMSTKKLPSRKMRERIWSRASSRIGSASLAQLHRHLGRAAAVLRLDLRDLADLDPGDPHRGARLQALRRRGTSPCSSYGFANGFAFVKPK